MKTPQQIAVARSVLKKVTLTGVHAKSAYYFLKSHRLQYMMKGRRVMRSNKWAHFGCDAGTIHGIHWLAVLGWSVEHQLGFWMCPQARRFVVCWCGVGSGVLGRVVNG